MKKLLHFEGVIVHMQKVRKAVIPAVGFGTRF